MYHQKHTTQYHPKRGRGGGWGMPAHTPQDYGKVKLIKIESALISFTTSKTI